MYDPEKVHVIVNSITITGYTEGSLVSCERNEDRMTPYVGAKGETDYAISNNNSGTVTISLQQSSPSNRMLQQLAESKALFPVSVVDMNTGGFRAGGNEGIVLKEPALERGNEISELEWEIYVGDYSQALT
jgi:hypothetical protein